MCLMTGMSALEISLLHFCSFLIKVVFPLLSSSTPLSGV